MNALNPVEEVFARQAECSWFLSLSRKEANARPPIADEKVVTLWAQVDQATPYWWSNDTAAAVLQASRTMPGDWCLRPELIPSRAGIWVLAKPLPILLSLPHNQPVEASRIDTIVWGTAKLNDHKTDAVVIGGFFERQIKNNQAIRGIELLHWQVGTPLIDPADRHIQEEDYQISDYIYDICRYFAAGLQFLDQRILVTETHPLPRATRRRLERAGGPPPPPVQVVMLRRTEPRPRKEGMPEPVDWQWHWMVSGHWRRQWYPSLSIHQPHFIFPYPKGNPDKPLHVRPTVYEVKR
jgi:hypothetical protein